MSVVKQVSVCNFILLIFAFVVLRKVHVHSLVTLKRRGHECLLLLDKKKNKQKNTHTKQSNQLNAVCLILTIFVHHLSEKISENRFIFVYLS